MDPAPFPERSKQIHDAAEKASKEAWVLMAKAQGLYGKRKTRAQRFKSARGG